MMRTPTCPREADVFDLVWTSQWPSRADAVLRAHVDRCPICTDLVAVASAVGDLDDVSSAEVRVPEAGAVWYSAQVRARQERARRAARPVLLAEMTAVACGVAGALFAWRVGGRSIANWWSTLPVPALPQWSDIAALASSPTFPWMAGAALAWALVVPAALYVARFADRPTEQPHDRS